MENRHAVYLFFSVKIQAGVTAIGGIQPSQVGIWHDIIDNRGEVMRTRTLKNAPNRAEIWHLYQTAFPKEEQLPWWLLRILTTLDRCDLTAYYDSDTFCGFTYTAAEGKILFVLFFAVDDGVRGRGYDSFSIKCVASLLGHSADNPICVRQRKGFSPAGRYDRIGTEEVILCKN